MVCLYVNQKWKHEPHDAYVPILHAVTDMEGFNSHLNMEQMNKALISLNDMYEKAAEKGEHCPNGSLAVLPSMCVRNTTLLTS